MRAPTDRVHAVASLQEFFKDSVADAMAKQGVAADDHTAYYVVNLLTLFARHETLFDQGKPGPGLQPVALLLAAAAESPSRDACNALLRRVGDTSLFVAGFLGDGFARKLVDIDYHIAMGGRAYGVLGEVLSRGKGRVLGNVFAELSQKFQPMVDALNELAETAYTHSDKDILRLYEIWLKTGSRRSYALLKRLGVDPTAAAGTQLAH